MVQALDDYDVQQDLPQAFKLLDEMNNNVKQVTDLVEGMLQKVKTGELSTEYGLSFLEIKYHMLLNYLINLTYVVLRKCSGETIEHDPSIDRLIEIRTVLEKIRPIDYKLKYQIDKLVKTAVTGATNSSDPTSFKPNPNNLISNTSTNDLSSNSSSEYEDDETDKKKKNKSNSSLGKTGVYVPPKLSAVHYDDDETPADREKKLIEKARKRALTSSMLQDLKEEYLDVPIEISSGSRAQQIISKAQKEKQEYEETYLTRLPITKAEKYRQRKLTTLGNLGDEITNFRNFNELIEGGGSTNSKSNKRKRKSGNGKKKGSKKRKFH